MNEKNVNECLYCGCYDEDFGCTMPSIDKWYACPLERNEEELREMFNMSNELIRKSDVLNLLNNTEVGECPYNCVGAALIAIHDAVEDMPPVNAVGLPCKIGDTVYEVIEECGAKGSFDCAYNGGHGYSRCRGRFAGKCEAYIQETHFVLSDFGYVGERIFLTREEAEKALEDLKND